jgi:DNA-binding NarL/FixJ family response regulator
MAQMIHALKDHMKTQTQDSKTRILIADDHESVRKGLHLILESRENLEVVGEAANGKEAIDRSRQLQPDVIIMDLKMPILDGLAAAQVIKKARPQTAILMFSMRTSRLFTEIMENMGMDGFVSKENDSAALLTAIDAVTHHQKYFPA